MRILAINPGSTSTKIALFENGVQVWDDTQRYDSDVIGKYPTVASQEDFRLEEIKKALKKHDTDPKTLDAVIGRGGLLSPISGGTYEVTDAMVEELRSERNGSHASNLGAPLAMRLAQEAGSDKAFIADPVVVDELMDIARLTGLPEITRRSIFHALNQKAIARHASAALGKEYEDCFLIVVHLGGGISVGAHLNGRVIDVNNALEGDGPFSPERVGNMPCGGFTKMCFSGDYTHDEIKKKIAGKGGMVAWLGTNDLREVERRIVEGDQKAKLVFDALVYNVAKEIGARSVTLKGKVDAIVLTGGLAYSEKFTNAIKDYVSFLAPIMIYPGEDELKALAEAADRVLEGKEKAKAYVPKA